MSDGTLDFASPSSRSKPVGHIVSWFVRLGPRSLAILLLVIVVAAVVFAPVLVPHDPFAQDLLNSRRPPVAGKRDDDGGQDHARKNRDPPGGP